jgi:O-antigen/teichoic acid export membrane protein
MSTQKTSHEIPKVLNQAVYYALGIIMMKGISLLMIPYVTRQLTPVEYGTLETLLIMADLGTIVIGFGMVEALNRFVGMSDKQDCNRWVANCFVLTLAVVGISVLLVFSFSSNIASLLPSKISNQQVLLILCPTLLEGLIAIPLTLMRMQALARRFCILNVAKAIAQAMIVVILLENGYGIDAILIAGAISSLGLVLLLIPYQWSQMGRQWYWGDSMTILRYGLPIIAGRLGLFAITGLDRWLLADKVGVEQLAVYAIAIKFALVLCLLMQPFGLWWFPYRFTLLKQNNGKKLCADYAMLGTNLGLALGFVMMLMLPSFMQLILPVEYHAASLIVMVMLMVNMIKNAGDLLNLGCFINSSDSQMWVQWLCALIAISGYFLLIDDYGVWAAVSVLLCVYALRLVLFYFYSQHVMKLPYQHRPWLIVCIIGLLQLMFFKFIFFETELLTQFLAASVLSISYLALLIIFDVFPNPLKWWKQKHSAEVII